MNHLNEKGRRDLNIILSVIAMLLFGYSAIRAFRLSFTSDESYTFIEYVANNFTTFSHYGSFDANNHLLNTWLMELSSKIFGISEFTLRLPNVLAHLIFLFYSARLVRHLSSPTLIIAAFLILNVNPFLLDFFSLARGYGISLALMMGSLCHAYEFIGLRRSYRSAFCAVLFAAVALLSYFLLLNYLLIITMVFVIVNFVRNNEVDLPNKSEKMLLQIRTALILMSPLAILLFALPIMFHLKAANAFAFGDHQGFWSDTVGSLIANNLYEDNAVKGAMDIVQTGVVVFIIIAIISMAWILSRREVRSRNPFFIFIFVVLFLCLIANGMQHEWMGINYLRGRYALYYYLLFLVLMIQFFDTLSKEKMVRISHSMGILIALFFIMNFLNAANLHYVNNWKKESDLKDMLHDVQRLSAERGLEKDTLNIGIPGLGWLFDYDFRFYSAINKDVKFKIIGAANFNSPIVDFHFADKDILLEHPHDSSFTVIKSYKSSEMLLIIGNK